MSYLTILGGITIICLFLWVVFDILFYLAQRVETLEEYLDKDAEASLPQGEKYRNQFNNLNKKV